MSIISMIPYTYVERKIKRTKKVTIQHSKDMCLYTDNIETENESFHINSVFDISYKCVSKESGFYTYIQIKECSLIPYTQILVIL